MCAPAFPYRRTYPSAHPTGRAPGNTAMSPIWANRGTATAEPSVCGASSRRVPRTRTAQVTQSAPAGGTTAAPARRPAERPSPATPARSGTPGAQAAGGHRRMSAADRGRRAARHRAGGSRRCPLRPPGRRRQLRVRRDRAAGGRADRLSHAARLALPLHPDHTAGPAAAPPAGPSSAHPQAGAAAPAPSPGPANAASDPTSAAPDATAHSPCPPRRTPAPAPRPTHAPTHAPTRRPSSPPPVLPRSHAQVSHKPHGRRSMVTTVLLLTAPAVLAGAALRPRSSSSSGSAGRRSS
ncbi:hypothetical protein SAMN05428942_4394 [Streptomyces sp. 2112.2]|nr:hypothetical protein SAMN05428942_4394 [Streptomyces sp. 2112.2]